MRERSNPPQEKKINAEEAMARLATTQTQFMNETRTSLQNQSAQIRNLEVQLSQMAGMLTERQQGNLPSTSEANPRKSGNEQCSAITLRSGKELKMPEKNSESVDQNHDQDNREHNKSEAPIEAPLSQDRFTRIPFPQRLKKNKLDQQFAKFLDVFKKLHINIPFAEALEQMPSYVKFMKEILSNKRKLKDYETVALTEECSAILQKKLPPKLKDPGSFTIPCSIGNVVFERALCDLGASINLMPLSIFKKLNLGEARPTTVTLQLADRSLKHPRGVIEDVLVKIDKFIFPTDFIVLDMEEDKDIPILLGRPFLATGRALIDVQKGELCLRVQEEEVTFNVFDAIKYPQASDCCFSIDDMQVILPNSVKLQDSLEASLTQECIDDIEEMEVKEYLEWMDSFEPNRRKYFEPLGQNPICLIPSINNPPILELKPLPTHLRYAYLGESTTLPVIISSSLSLKEEDKLLRVLREHKSAIGWSLADIRGIRPSMCYNQIAIAQEGQEKTTFTCPYGTFAFRRMPFGLCNAPGTFQRCMMAIFSDMVEHIIEVFMDDFSVVGSSFDNCLDNLQLVLKRCEETNLVLNWEKCHFMVREGIVLGHKISSKGIEVDRAKIETIGKLPPPTSVKGVRSFLVMLDFIEGLSKISPRSPSHYLIFLRRESLLCLMKNVNGLSFIFEGQISINTHSCDSKLGITI
ncbi:uncharacterized protein LOC120281228 [Dioscorea cayenensis subsp. rotundata]|uniref:Uncharacterized protein LOC120281228 n=1 Tax=Dioscorea cayennensis subsp. rotundata TaxID=55577 RepID=A0AB40CVK2_DIOCR|nr:uncharacterized protein LOC120281228 [Dioscorea cayenensis subsp. rotundata]